MFSLLPTNSSMINVLTQENIRFPAYKLSLQTLICRMTHEMMIKDIALVNSVVLCIVYLL